MGSFGSRSKINNHIHAKLGGVLVRLRCEGKLSFDGDSTTKDGASHSEQKVSNGVMPNMSTGGKKSLAS